MSENENTALVALGGETDDLMQIAANAEKRIDAVMKIKRVALKVTNAMDWVNQRGKTPEQDKPYLMASGSEKIANLFNISWRLLSPEPGMELEGDGNFTYTYSGEFSMGNRTIQCEGSRSSRDKFFTQYEYQEGKDRKEKLVSDRDNKRDVKMAAFTNLLGNGITRLLGIRNLTYADLLEFAGITKEQLQKVVYKTNPKADVKPAPVKDNPATSSQPPDGQGQPVDDDKQMLFEKLRALCLGDQAKMTAQLKRLTAYESKKTGKKSDGKTSIDDVSPMEAKIALQKLNKELEADDQRASE